MQGNRDVHHGKRLSVTLGLLERAQMSMRLKPLPSKEMG